MGHKEKGINPCIWREYSTDVLKKTFLLKTAY